MANMGFGFGLNAADTKFKRKNRWLFKIPSISDESLFALPPSKAARPSISFKEIEAQHISETVYYPSKPDWKPINLTLYDINREGALDHPVFKWLKSFYDPQKGILNYSCGPGGSTIVSQSSQTTRFPQNFKKPEAFLEMYDGCGCIIEKWKFETVWPQSVDFGELDMMSSDITTCDIVLRYDRAYIESDIFSSEYIGDVNTPPIDPLSPTGIA